MTQITNGFNISGSIQIDYKKKNYCKLDFK